MASIASPHLPWGKYPFETITLMLVLKIYLRRLKIKTNFFFSSSEIYRSTKRVYSNYRVI